LQITEKTATPPQKKSVLDFLFGRPLSSDEDVKEQIRSSAGVPVFGLDALSSAAYGPEAALTILIPLGLAGVAYTVRSPSQNSLTGVDDPRQFWPSGFDEAMY
jgi:hypothetical protein